METIIKKPQDQEELDQLEIDKMNILEVAPGHHLHNEFDSRACCN